MAKRTAYREILSIKDQIPTKVFEDVKKRSEDWLGSGGEEDDAYIQSQLRYAKHFLETR